ncbi:MULTISPECIES: hypothetical protein [unclassified Bradyrhizobium]|uniref:hypothetical protein n=1 Tax=unclassified Bradyrhizobium TaxID=2631580 RepID=UPI0012EB23BD|nr:MULTISPECIES: hypothetical protein [unclassified Bradyrhizobium]MCP3466403.1 hypothetical protein [Bradyrhizobium sp. CCGUVB23]
MHNPDAAVQYLTWALEEIENGHPKAALHARIALDELRGVHAGMPCPYAEKAKRFRDKADEAEQLAVPAETASRRDALMKIVGNYRRTAEQMDRLSEAQTTTKSK